MQSKLCDLVLAMSEDIELEQAYRRDPEAFMRAHGLSESEKQALRTGDEAAIGRSSGQTDECVFAKFIVAPRREAERALRKAA